jgi:hypothetical protein
LPLASSSSCLQQAKRSLQPTRRDPGMTHCRGDTDASVQPTLLTAGHIGSVERHRHHDAHRFGLHDLRRPQPLHAAAWAALSKSLLTPRSTHADTTWPSSLIPSSRIAVPFGCGWRRVLMFGVTRRIGTGAGPGQPTRQNPTGAEGQHVAPAAQGRGASARPPRWSGVGALVNSKAIANATRMSDMPDRIVSRTCDSMERLCGVDWRPPTGAVPMYSEDSIKIELAGHAHEQVA